MLTFFFLGISRSQDQLSEIIQLGLTLFLVIILNMTVNDIINKIIVFEKNINNLFSFYWTFLHQSSEESGLSSDVSFSVERNMFFGKQEHFNGRWQWDSLTFWKI